MDQEVPGSLLFLHGYILERLPPDPGPRRRAVVQADSEDRSDSPTELELTPEDVREILRDRPERLEIAKEADGVSPIARVVVQLPDAKEGLQVAGDGLGVTGDR